ncbi:hypothetical protein GLAREA_06700 [Glarea lozoyensis ATCC 20868]|uniref:DUF6594 domain-containing protein n=1 Tax=Glarea lozoyensis (strain ATCC 20868 / MF5171) TaxID=1116229 RepID=S3D5D9_GLAL2|nr:uncharacterized protein GLAREA_06700 [Glarea lozoyensis ATCC 20868]EPE33687.1 hypothetical protein GLAREA_06700 [Glarea lozoyensis ATCC 20868]
MSTGYHKITQFMIQHKEMAVFSRFEYLQVLKTLVLQGELASLEEDIKKELGPQEIVPSRLSLDLRPGDLNIELQSLSSRVSRSTRSDSEVDSDSDVDSDEDSGKIDAVEGIDPRRDIYFLQKMNSTENVWKNIVLANEKLDEYNKAIRDLEAMYSRDPPCESTHTFLKHWFMCRNLGNSPIMGVDCVIYRENTPRTSLMSIFPAKDPDALSNFFLKIFKKFFHNKIGRHFGRSRVRVGTDPEMSGSGGYFYYRDEGFMRMADIVGSLISSIWLVTSIVILYFLRDMRSRLAIIAVFTVGFSLILSLLTRARRAEVFGGSAA